MKQQTTKAIIITILMLMVLSGFLFLITYFISPGQLSKARVLGIIGAAILGAAAFYSGFKDIYDFVTDLLDKFTGQKERSQNSTHIDSEAVSSIFLGYVNYIDLDESVASELMVLLRDKGYQVYVEPSLEFELDRIQTIRRQISESDYFIVLLSQISVNNEMILEEVKFAYELQAGNHAPKIIAVKLNYPGLVPYYLEIYLQESQFALWDSNEPPSQNAKNIIEKVSNRRNLHKREAFDLTSELSKTNLLGQGEKNENTNSLLGQGLNGEIIKNNDKGVIWQNPTNSTKHGVPLVQPTSHVDPRVILEVPQGVVNLESLLYVERNADKKLKDQMSRSGTMTYIRAPRQMGKTSLLLRGINYSERFDSSVVFVDFQVINSFYHRNLDAFLFYLAQLISTELKLDPNILVEYWDEPKKASTNRLTDYIEDQILRMATKPVVLAIDEADRLLESDICQEFFSLIRSWDTKRGYRPEWKKLNIILVISTEPYLLIENVNLSPFNVGLRIDLEDFNFQQVQDLNERHASPLNVQELNEMMNLLGGHPYLVRQALFTLVNEKMTWAKLTQIAVDQVSPFSAHLRQYLWQLREKPELILALKDVMIKGTHPNEVSLIRLDAAGLIRPNGERMWTYRSQLYEQYFRSYIS